MKLTMRKRTTRITEEMIDLLHQTLYRRKRPEDLEIGDDTVMWGFYQEGKLVGCARVYESLDEEDIPSFLYDFAIDPDYQKQGLGTHFARKIIQRYGNIELVAVNKSDKFFWPRFNFHLTHCCSTGCTHMRNH